MTATQDTRPVYLSDSQVTDLTPGAMIDNGTDELTEHPERIRSMTPVDAGEADPQDGWFIITFASGATRRLYARASVRTYLDAVTARYILRRDPAAEHEHVYDDVEGDPAICPRYACPFGVR